MRRLGILLAGVVFAALYTPAAAESTFCSDPHRARVLDSMSVAIPNGDETAFANTMREFESVTDMSLSEVSSSRGGNVTSRALLFQSPEVSVLIDISTEADSNIAEIAIERTCITDALERWRPYWRAFRGFMQSHGFEER
jgi:hypothetical protein